MGKQQPHSPASGSSLNTLVQNGTSQMNNGIYKPEITVHGNGTDVSNDKAMKGKAKRKTITQAMALSLVDVAKNNGRLERMQPYWNTYHCQNKVYSSGGRLYGMYCKNRFCTLCCANRKADIMNRYLPIIRQWEAPYFVTLTVKAVPARLLKSRIKKGIIRAFQQITAKYRKKHQRGKGIKLMGIKSLECNFNPIRKTYNPHLHLIVPSKEIADILVKEWLLKWGKEFTSSKAQHRTQVRNKEQALIEIVKYGSKIFTEPDVNKKATQKGQHQIHTAALDNIFRAMQGCRIFERFGFNLVLDQTHEKKKTILRTYEKWEFNMQHSDWLNQETLKGLTGYMVNNELYTLLSAKINQTSQ
ncbi:MAG: protein rep [Cytophagaceae bacterium]|nr:protein rep [Cytophagaceae bacterium]